MRRAVLFAALSVLALAGCNQESKNEDASKIEVQAFKGGFGIDAYQEAAKEYDERNNEPDCEVDEKMDLLRRVAKLVGVDLDDVIGKKGAV